MKRSAKRGSDPVARNCPLLLPFPPFHTIRPPFTILAPLLGSLYGPWLLPLKAPLNSGFVPNSSSKLPMRTRVLPLGWLLGCGWSACPQPIAQFRRRAERAIVVLHLYTPLERGGRAALEQLIGGPAELTVA